MEDILARQIQSGHVNLGIEILGLNLYVVPGSISDQYPNEKWPYGPPSPPPPTRQPHPGIRAHCIVVCIAGGIHAYF